MKESLYSVFTKHLYRITDKVKALLTEPELDEELDMTFNTREEIDPRQITTSPISEVTETFNSLSPLTTKADIITHNGTNSIRLGIGSNDQVLTADSSTSSGLNWTTLNIGTHPVNLTNDVTGTLPIANGGTNNTTFTSNGIIYYDGSKLATDTPTGVSGGITWDSTNSEFLVEKNGNKTVIGINDIYIDASTDSNFNFLKFDSNHSGSGGGEYTAFTVGVDNSRNLRIKIGQNIGTNIATLALATSSERPVLGDTQSGYGVFLDPQIERSSNAGHTHPIMAALNIEQMANSAGSATITNAAGLRIADAPTTGTNTYALWIDAGRSRFDGDGTDVFELPADATDPTGGGGAAAGRIPVKIGGVTKYIPYY